MTTIQGRVREIGNALVGAIMGKGKLQRNKISYLLDRSDVEARIGASSVILPGDRFGNLLLVRIRDDKAVAVHARVVGSLGCVGGIARRMDVVDVPIYSNTNDPEGFTKQVFNIASGISNCTVLVDATGIGVYVYRQLENLGLPEIIIVKWGSSCQNPMNKERFFNQRALAMVRASEAIKDGRLTLPGCRYYTEDIIDQASRIPYHFNEKARYCIMQRDCMRTEGIPLPGIWEAICFGFLEDATYIAA